MAFRLLGTLERLVRSARASPHLLIISLPNEELTVGLSPYFVILSMVFSDGSFKRRRFVPDLPKLQVRAHTKAHIS